MKAIFYEVKNHQWRQESNVIKWENEKFVIFLSCQIPALYLQSSLRRQACNNLLVLAFHSLFLVKFPLA